MNDDEKMREAMAWIEKRRDEGNLSAYYYTFSPTGDADVDLILAAVAAAGKGCHHTQDWGSTGIDGGPSYIDQIQEAANRAASKMSLERTDD